MTANFSKSAALLALWFCAPSLDAVEDRIRLPVVINGKEVTFALDTGFGTSLVLFRDEAERMKLRITPPRDDIRAGPGKVLLGETEACAVAFLGHTESVPLAVLETPWGAGTDGVVGVVGWPVLSRQIVSFKPAGNNEHVNIEAVLPTDQKGWLKVRVLPGPILALEIPGAAGDAVIVRVDTGDSDGVILRTEPFRSWRKKNPATPTTLTARMLPATGLMISQEVWADEIDLGQMLLRNAPVIEGTTDFEGAPPNVIAVIGMAALRRLDLVVDGRDGSAYVRPSQASTAGYDHNRMGAVFTPAETQSSDLVATVAANSPAEQSGVRNGDVLLKIDSLDVTPWRTQPGILPLARFWSSPAGTRLTLSVRRSGKTIVIPVVLRDILRPKPQKKR